MKHIIIRYGCGYGTHTTDFEIEDDATDEEIEQAAQDAAMERFEWSYSIDGVPQ